MAVNDPNTVSRKVTLADGSRRGFLRGFGFGSVPVTDALRDRYVAWLGNEYAAALFERDATAHAGIAILNRDWRYTRTRMPLHEFEAVPDIERLTAWTLPSARAAVILSAAGIPLA